MKSLCFALAGSVGLLFGGAVAHAQVCTLNSDCAAPLVCKAGAKTCMGSAHLLPDGGVESTESCTSDPAKCAWPLQACTADSQCTQTLWSCQQLPAEGASKICFPNGIPCAAGQTCPTGWSCVDFATVKERDMVDMWKPNGQTKFCFPDVLRGVADGTTKVDNSAIDIGVATRGDSPSGGSAPSVDGGSISVGAPANTSAGSSTTSTPATSTPAKDNSGCSFGGRGDATWPCLLAALVALRLRRRLNAGGGCRCL